MRKVIALLTVVITSMYFVSCISSSEQPVEANTEKPVIVAYVGGFPWKSYRKRKPHEAFTHQLRIR
jgi:hypothetical protein